MAQCSSVNWCFKCFAKVLSSLLGPAGNMLCHDIAKQVYYTACAADRTGEVLMDNGSADKEKNKYL